MKSLSKVVEVFVTLTLQFLFVVIIMIIPFFSWCNHLYVCFSENLWGFLIAGAMFFPVGTIHGFGCFVGWW